MIKVKLNQNIEKGGIVLMKSIKRIAAALLVLVLVLPYLCTSDKVNAAESVLKGNSAAEVWYNTGNYAVQVVRQDLIKEKGDASFDKDGSYTINIPEDNPFFPYEVQFTCNGTTENKWFMTPDDSVEVGGHKFNVSAHFDNLTLTQATLMVAGKEVIVYPEEKEFTNDGSMVMPLSLLPLTEKHLTVDLTGFTPLELTMISVGKIFSGNQLEGASSVVWDYYSQDDYEVTTPDGTIDSTNSSYLNIIVGDGDQLNDQNVRYVVNVEKTDSDNWLNTDVYVQDENGVRKKVQAESRFSDSSYTYSYNGMKVKLLNLYTSESEIKQYEQAYIKLNLNKENFADRNFDNVRVYEGSYSTAEEAAKGKDITDKIFCKDISSKNAGYMIHTRYSNYITLVEYSAEKKVIGWLPIRISFRNNYFSYISLLYNEEDLNVSSGDKSSLVDGYTAVTYTLYPQYAADGKYYWKPYFYKGGETDNSAVTAAYIGKYNSINEAKKAGAADIKNELFSRKGYGTDYSKGVYFSIFAGEDDSTGQITGHYYVKTEAVTQENPGDSGIPGNSGMPGNSGTQLYINGLKYIDKNTKKSKNVSFYKVSSDADSYGENNYITIFVDKDTDLSSIAPIFSSSDKSNVYAEGSSTPDKSGESIHNFENGPIQYTVSAENGLDSKNYWVSVVKAQDGQGKIYITSLADEDSNTKTEKNVIYSTRQVMLDRLHDDKHDILVANMGTQAISNLGIELKSDVIELDEYWTFTGKSDLNGFSTINKNTSYGELPNLAKIRIKAKKDIEDGTDVTGTLTIKSDDKTLAVLTLTGVVGDPSITTKEVPQAVKYVPYGTMIQNSNKYGWNKVSYELIAGKLPEGMEVKTNGEIYGVPKESGKFTFWVRMNNSYGSFSSSTKTFTLEVIENTDENVNNATDRGYDLTQRIIDVNNAQSYLMISQGVISEFRAVYLDGQKLEEGKDYNAKSGSTRITIEGQTLNNAGEGNHTLGVEFRTTDDTLKRAAQNYTINWDDNDSYEDDSADNNLPLDDKFNKDTEFVSSGDDENGAESSGTMPEIAAAASDSNNVYTIVYLGDGAGFLKINCNKAHAYDISRNNPKMEYLVTVVMTPPSGIDISKTAILHLNADNEIDKVFYNGNGYTYDEAANKVTFKVSHFSKFIFVEMEDIKELSNTVNISAPTGDSTDYMKWLILSLLSVIMILGCLFKKGIQLN